ncbi:TFIIH C1-like domain containing protein [Parasponia andersonii]|uniref:TFIIH C1-like domain containing protein n=1 Tax=Parasponia andersonii TaxID=3476 RepID=A0A2P5B6N2_PARAD|nr:TFIIH C1-like domain containing protein [Parasponia andersonii]
MAEEKIPNGFSQNPIEGSNNIMINPPPLKKKRNLPGTPGKFSFMYVYPEAEVIALSPKTLMATNRFLCEICGKGFQRDQNLQLHRRGHNLPWKLKQRSSKEPKKRVYVCPEKTCVHHHPSRALGDLTGIKKHFCRKHGEKKWKCEKCSKRYAVQSDWKAHSKTCGTREYKCDCGTLFSRRDSFITHRAFCDALAEETARVKAASDMNIMNPIMAAAGNISYHFMGAGSGPNFPSVFKPISSNDEAAATARGLSLWIGGQDQTIMGSPNTTNNALQDEIRHHNHHHHQLGSVSSASAVFGPDHNHHPLVSCCSSNHPPPSDYHHHQMNWVFGSSTNKISSNNNAHHEELTISDTCSLPMSNSTVNKEGGNGTQLVSVPSLYSTQLSSTNSHNSAAAAAANMSATALLQKAAQIGATSSVDTSFLGSLGLKCNNSTTSTNTQVRDGNNNIKSCGLYGSTPISGVGSHRNINDNNVENPDGEILQMYPPAAKRRHVLVSSSTAEEAAGGQTRDFLGVGGGGGGVQPICHPAAAAAAAAASSINGWI